ncbi:MAG: hypothetical protein M1823_000762 [Watsoniomyces obsoletus]|nr:MAG: hypothetical protein M1823_000762 [Watsoniomyces obsoletus]
MVDEGANRPRTRAQTRLERERQNDSPALDEHDDDPQRSPPIKRPRKKQPATRKDVSSTSPERLPLTTQNLLRLQTLERLRLPPTPDQFDDPTRTKKPPSEYLGRGCRPSQRELSAPDRPCPSPSRESTIFSDTSMTSLHTDFLTFGKLLARDHGVMDYRYVIPRDLEAQKVRLGEPAPSNLDEVMTALARPRTDSPTLADLRDYCRAIHDAHLTQREADVRTLIDLLLGPIMRRDDSSSYAQPSLEMLSTLLPSGQLALTPDMTIGLRDSSLGAEQSWLVDALSLHVRASGMICCNGVVELKSSAGNMVKARIQNRAASSVLYRAWQQVDQHLFKEERKSFGKAYVGSISTRDYHVYCYRVAVGTPYATSLSEFQETHGRLANFLDWMKEVRLERLREVEEKMPPDVTPEGEQVIEEMCQPPDPKAPLAMAVARAQDRN